MKAHTFLAIFLLGGLGSACFADTEDGTFDATVKACVEQIKKARPVDDPKNAEFYRVFSALRIDFQANNTWMFENANWPLILQQRAEREIRLRRVRSAAKSATTRSTPFRPSGNSKLKPAANLDSDLDLHSTYDRKDGKRRFIRRVDEPRK